MGKMYGWELPEGTVTVVVQELPTGDLKIRCYDGSGNLLAEKTLTTGTKTTPDGKTVTTYEVT